MRLERGTVIFVLGLEVPHFDSAVERPRRDVLRVMTKGSRNDRGQLISRVGRNESVVHQFVIRLVRVDQEHFPILPAGGDDFV